MGKLRQANGGNGNPVLGDDELAGPGIDLWAQFGVRLESLTAQMEETNRRWRRLWDSTHRVQITGPQIPDDPVPDGTFVVVDRPDLLGPRRGWYWDVARLTFADAANTGTAPPVPVIVWKNYPTGTNVVDVFTNGEDDPVSHFYGKGQLLLGPDEHLVYGVTTQIGGVWAVGGEAVQVADDCLPLYLR